MHKLAKRFERSQTMDRGRKSCVLGGVVALERAAKCEQARMSQCDNSGCGVPTCVHQFGVCKDAELKPGATWKPCDAVSGARCRCKCSAADFSAASGLSRLSHRLKSACAIQTDRLTVRLGAPGLHATTRSRRSGLFPVCALRAKSLRSGNPLQCAGKTQKALKFAAIRHDSVAGQRLLVRSHSAPPSVSCAGLNPPAKE
jgi:hypothetical protein